MPMVLRLGPVHVGRGSFRWVHVSCRSARLPHLWCVLASAVHPPTGFLVTSLPTPRVDPGCRGAPGLSANGGYLNLACQRSGWVHCPLARVHFRTPLLPGAADYHRAFSHVVTMSAVRTHGYACSQPAHMVLATAFTLPICMDAARKKPPTGQDDVTARFLQVLYRYGVSFHVPGDFLSLLLDCPACDCLLPVSDLADVGPPCVLARRVFTNGLAPESSLLDFLDLACMNLPPKVLHATVFPDEPLLSTILSHAHMCWCCWLCFWLLCGSI